MHLMSYNPVCDKTQNMNATESETFFRYQFFLIPNPILLSIPNFFDTESETILKMEKFRNREVSKPKCHTLLGAGVAYQYSGREDHRPLSQRDGLDQDWYDMSMIHDEISLKSIKIITKFSQVQSKERGGVSRVMSSTRVTFCGCSECELASQIWPGRQLEGVPGVPNMGARCPHYSLDIQSRKCLHGREFVKKADKILDRIDFVFTRLKKWKTRIII